MAGPAAARGGRGGRRRGVRDRAAGGIRVPAGPRVAASQHPGDLGGRGRGAGAERRPRAFPLSRAPGRARCRVPHPGRRQGQLLPAAGTAGPGRAGRVLLRRPARPADLRRRRDAGPVHQGHNPAAGRRAGWRRLGRRLPADSRARRGPARRRPAGRRGRHPGVRRPRGAQRREAPGSGPGPAGRHVQRPAGGRRRAARLRRPGRRVGPGDRGRQGHDQAGRPERGRVRPSARA